MNQKHPDLIRPAGSLVPQGAPFVSGAGFDSAPEETMALRDWLRVARRRAWLIIAAVAVSMAVAAYVGVRRVPDYRANAVVTVGSEGGMGGALGALGGIGSVLGVTGANNISSELELLKSRQVGAEVVDSTGLRIQWQKGERKFPLGLLEDVRVAEDAPSLRLDLALGEDGVVVRADSEEVRAPYGTPVQLAGVTFTVASRPEDEEVKTARLEVVTKNRAIDIFLGGLFARQRDRTNVVDVGYTSKDPIVSQRVANSVIAIFKQRTSEKAQAVNRKQLAVLAEQINRNDSSLLATQQRLAQFQESATVYNTAAKAQGRQAGLLELQIREEEKDAERKTIAALLPQLQNARDGEQTLQTLLASSTISSSPIVSKLYTDFVTYQTTRDTLTAGPTGRSASNPDVKRVDELIASTRTRLIAAMSTQVRALDAEIATLERQQAEASSELRSLPSPDAEQMRLEQLIEGYGEEGFFLRQEYTKLRLAGLADNSGVEIVDLALPGWTVGTGLMQTLVFGLLIGLAIGGGGAALLEYGNTSIRGREEVERMLQVPPLAVIPRFAPASARRLPVRLPALRGGNGNGREIGNGVGSHVLTPGGADLVAASHVDSLGAEAYRTLRTNLIFSQAVQSLKTLMVTSPSGGEGRTTVAANLATTFAQQGMRVLLVDCDLRRSRLHTLMGVPREPGLTQLLLGDLPVDQVVHATGIERLSVLPAGTPTMSPSEILGSAHMHDALAELSSQFDLVVLDTPPLLASAAGTATLAAQVDGVLVVLRAGQTERDAAQDALQQLATVGARVVGAVLNDPDAQLSARSPGAAATTV